MVFASLSNSTEGHLFLDSAVYLHYKYKAPGENIAMKRIRPDSEIYGKGSNVQSVKF